MENQNIRKDDYMSKDCCSPKDTDCCEEVDVNVKVNVDVGKIVKYVCITAVLIVGIIFGTNCYNNMLSNDRAQL